DPRFDTGAHQAALADVAAAGGVPILFPSAGLAALDEGELAGAHAAVAPAVDRLLGFELGRQFHRLGRIWDLDTFTAILEIPQAVGAKHSSLSAPRRGFLALPATALATEWGGGGSASLRGLPPRAPAPFPRRDRLWAARDAR